MDKESMLPKYTRLESIRYANHIKKEGASTARMEDYLEVIYELVEHKRLRYYNRNLNTSTLVLQVLHI